MTEEQLIPPVKVGDIIEDQTVISAGKRNDGVIKYQGFILFVNSVSIGDIVTVKVTKVLPKFGVAEIL